jgi:UDP-N-acetylglucosamine acyltransferase
VAKIHPLAAVSKEAVIADDVTIGPCATIEGPVRIGAGCDILGGARLLGPLTLGARNVVHGTAVLGGWPQDRKFKGEHSELIIGDDNIFREGVTIHRGTGAGTKTLIGSRCYFMVNSHVGHNCVIGSDVTFVNGAMAGGHVQVADRAILGAYSAIHQFCRVGRLAMPTNGAMYSVDVPPYFIGMKTNVVVQLNVVGMRRSGMKRESINAIREMFQHIYRTHGRLLLATAFEKLPPRLLAFEEVQEFIAFCRGTKRGVARFQPWSVGKTGSAGGGDSLEG